MKAKIRKTGEIVDVTRNKHGFYVDENRVGYTLNDLDFGNEEDEHWQDVRERAAIAFMNKLISPITSEIDKDKNKKLIKHSIELADSLIEELKKK